jgi:hypothetical protein
MGCLVAVRPSGVGTTSGAAVDTGGSVFADVGEGFRYLWQNAWLWATFLAATFAYLLIMGPLEVLLPYIVKNDLRGGAGDLGVILACGGVGAIASALTMARVGPPRRSVTFVYVTWTLSTFTLVGFGLAGASWQAMAVSFAFNAFEAAGTVVWLTTKQRLVPRALLGRVSSFDWFISTGLVPLSFAITAPVSGAIGAQNTFLLAGVLGAAVTLAFLFLPGVRDVEGRREAGGRGVAVEHAVAA